MQVADHPNIQMQRFTTFIIIRIFSVCSHLAHLEQLFGNISISRFVHSSICEHSNQMWDKTSELKTDKRGVLLLEPWSSLSVV